MSTPIQEEEAEEYQFRPDPSFKMFLREISTPRLIGIINTLCGTSYPLDSVVDFGSTEHFKVLGDLKKNLVRGDFVSTIRTDDHEETTNKIIIELQSTSDKTMGFRMFVYSLNVAEEDEDTQTYTFPKSATIYTTTDKPRDGVDRVHMIIDQFWVGEKEYSAAKGDKLTVDFPFINVLAMDFEEFQNSPLELLQVMYPYLYRKKPELMKDTAKLNWVMKTIRDFVDKETGNDKLVINKILADILMDLIKVCQEKDFGEELAIMEHLYKSHSDHIMETAEARAEKRRNLEIAQNLLDVLDNPIIALKTGLPLAEIERLRTATQ